MLTVVVDLVSHGSRTRIRYLWEPPGRSEARHPPRLSRKPHKLLPRHLHHQHPLLVRRPAVQARLCRATTLARLRRAPLHQHQHQSQRLRRYHLSRMPRHPPLLHQLLRQRLLVVLQAPNI